MTTTSSGADHRQPSDGQSSGGREAWLRLGLAAELPSIGAARQTVGRFLELADVTEEDTESLVLVTSELCTNAVEATPRPEDGELVVACRVADRSVELKVTNRGEPFEPDPEPQLPEPDADGGRGLYLVDSLTDRLVVRHRAGRTTVTATRHLPEPDPDGDHPGAGAGAGVGVGGSGRA